MHVLFTDLLQSVAIPWYFYRMKTHLRLTATAVLLTAALSASCAEPFRSTLFPADWTPDHVDGEGRFLHDFSYAGYHQGEVPLPTVFPGGTVDVVVDHGADPSGVTDSTGAIQAAIDAAELAGGGVVYIPKGLYRCDGVLRVDQSNVAIRGDSPEKSRLYFTRSTDMGYSAHLTFAGSVSREVDILLTADVPNRATDVLVSDAGDLAPGDRVALGWTITDEFIADHGMTGTWVSFNGQWKPFFRRTIVAIDRNVTPHRITLDVPTRYPALMRDGVSLRRESGYLEECAVVDLGLANAVDYDTAWSLNQVHVLEMTAVYNCFIRNVKSFASPFPGEGDYHLQSSGVEISNARQVTVADCRMDNAQNRGGGGNGYLFEVRQSGEILFQDCVARNGRHNFIQNWDFGATGIVWLRCDSEGSTAVTRAGDFEFPLRAYSEYHHSLATANLVDSCRLADGWAGGNRGSESSGAGHSAAQCVYWNIDGAGNGRIRAFSYGHGYVIGTRDVEVYTNNDISFSNLDEGTAPNDFREGTDNGATLIPQSLYEAQRAMRLGFTEGEGDTEGVGEGEGTSEGSVEGATEGSSEGEGTSEGTIEGATEGDSEGEHDGEGSPEGNIDGEGSNCKASTHTADIDGDHTIGFGELLRLIQIYNAPSFGCDMGSEDGFAPNVTGQDCCPHDTDFRLPHWSLDLGELLRGIQLYHLGGYTTCQQSRTEDGFCPNPE